MYHSTRTGDTLSTALANEFLRNIWTWTQSGCTDGWPSGDWGSRGACGCGPTQSSAPPTIIRILDHRQLVDITGPWLMLSPWPATRLEPGLHTAAVRFFSRLVTCHDYTAIMTRNSIRNIYGLPSLSLPRWRWGCCCCCMYTVSKKNSQNCFHQNFVKFPLTLIIFGTKMAKTIELCKVHSFSTSPNLCQRTTVPSLCQKLSKLMESWRSSDENNFDCFFWDTVYTVHQVDHK